jgi:hypothetical protein
MSTEDVLWDYLRNHVKGPHYTRVENLVHPGISDVNYCYFGSEGWMELKYRPTFPRPKMRCFNDDDGLNPAQKIWITAHVEMKGVVWIVAGVVTDVYFIPGRHAYEFNNWTLAELRAHARLHVVRGKPGFDTRVLRLIRGVI